MGFFDDPLDAITTIKDPVGRLIGNAAGSDAGGYVGARLS